MSEYLLGHRTALSATRFGRCKPIEVVGNPIHRIVSDPAYLRNNQALGGMLTGCEVVASDDSQNHAESASVGAASGFRVGKAAQQVFRDHTLTSQRATGAATSAEQRP